MNHRRWISFLLVLFLLGMAFSACAKEEPAPTEDYDFSVFFGGGDSPIKVNELVNQYQAETGLRIEPIFSESGGKEGRALERALQSSHPAAAFVAMEDMDISDLAGEGYIADLSAISKEVDGSGIPWRYRGRGLAADQDMLADLVGKEKVSDLIAALKRADYGEWKTFTLSLSLYIRTGKVEPFDLSGSTFRFAAKKGEATDGLNGVFALAGVGTDEQDAYWKSLMEQSLRTSNLESWEAARMTTTSEAFALIGPGINLYLEGLEDATDHLAGRYSAGIRGVDFINPDLYGPENAREIFMAGKAVFLPADSADFAGLSNLNAMRARNLILLPLKLPYESYGLPVGLPGGPPINTALAAKVESSFYINGNLPKGTRKKALDFVLWLKESAGAWDDPLMNAVREYYEADAVYPYDFTYDLSRYERVVGGRYGLDLWLSDNLWDESKKATLRNFLFETWYKE